MMKQEVYHIVKWGEHKRANLQKKKSTKALNGARIDYLCNKLGMINIYTLALEGVLLEWT